MSATVPKFAGGISGRHLGRIQSTPEQRERVLPLRSFIDLRAAPPPPTFGYYTKASPAIRSMMGNDSQGDCEAVAIAKHLAIATAEVPGGTLVTPSAAEVLAWYHAVGGGADNGLVMTQAMDYARDVGFRFGNKLRRIDGYVSVDPKNAQLVNVAAYLFGGLQIGINLPLAWYQRAGDADVWDVTDSRVVGGHAVPLTGVAPDRLRIATWAQEPHMTRAAFHDGRHVDECYAMLAAEWYNAAGMSAAGVNVGALKAALEAIRAGGTPDVPPDPNPPTPPPTPPPPAGPGQWRGQGVMEVLGAALQMELSGTFAPPAPVAAPHDYFALLADALALFASIRAKDWGAVGAALAKLLSDMGLSLAAAERQALTVEIADRLALEALTARRAPQ